MGELGIEKMGRGRTLGRRSKDRLRYEDLRYGELERGEAGDERPRARSERTEVPTHTQRKSLHRERACTGTSLYG